MIRISSSLTLCRSGAGKTTLLDVLARRITPNSGKLLLDGTQYKSKQVRQIAAFVPQQDILMEVMTVRETFRFYAELKLPQTMSKEEKHSRVHHTSQNNNYSHNTLISFHIFR